MHPTVWERVDGRRGPAPSHTRNDVAAAAIELADDGGLPAVSTRRIAQKLGVSQSALYRYVSGRDDVLDLMVDAVAGEIDLDIPLRGKPIDDLTGLATRAKNVHVRYPWLLDFPVEPMRAGPRSIDFLEYALRAMAPVEVPGPVKLQAVAILNTLVQQFARAEIGAGMASQERRVAQALFLHKTAHDGGHPNLAAALEIRDSGLDQPVDLFESVLRRVLEGFLSPD
ncbi:TetR/AcrR family transcriptional regulator [Rhodococcus chondri]|uniref:TetR/AcrR family transcriptional regulator n=1 Tax=Rhodococcus chondri TaxID=3065941 RepID=A0ABU7JQV5_9NOCA|nr:TetR/AcrR family transcriptional regulator [Rhodococcus sp. CC-R104]MEE2032274.1 TetR/AcrR family transcriptional regulator [Rhodococcus sp. CC-R104]